MLEGAGYYLPESSFRCDAHEFLHLSKEGEAELAAGGGARALDTLDEALDLWRGPIPEELESADGLRPHLLVLDDVWRTSASHRIDAYLREDRAEEVLGELRGAVEEDPLNEHTWYQLMMGLHQNGHRNDALMVYHEAKDTFVDLLGIGPTQRLEDLYSTILGVRAEAGPHHDGGGAAPPRGGVGIVDRDNELGVLHSAWTRTRDGVQVVAVTGEPGIGKTALVEEFSSHILSQGGAVVTGRSRQMLTGAYHPLREILSSFAHQFPSSREFLRNSRHTRALGRLVPQFAKDEQHPQGPLPVHPVETMEGVAAWCEELTTGVPLLIVVEDAQWADPQTLLAVQHLVDCPRTIRALIVVTIRDTEDRRTETGFLFRQGPRVTHVALPRVGEETTRRIVRDQAGTDVSQEFGTRIHRLSGGNPLFAVEIARHFRLTGETPDEPPSGLRHVVEEHVAALGEPTSDLLRVASIFGAEIDLGVLAAMADGAVEDIDECLTTSTRGGVLTQESETMYTFSHEVVRDVLYTAIPPLRRAELHSTIASVLIEVGPDNMGDFHTKVVHHLKRGLGDSPSNAAEHLYFAGREALRVNVHPYARQTLAEALDLLNGSDDEGLRCDVLTLLGTAELRSGSGSYRNTLLQAVRAAQRLGDYDRLFAAVLANTRGWWSSSTHVDHELVAGIEAALAVCEEADVARRSQLLIMWAEENLLDDTRREEVLAASEEALDLAQRQGEPDVVTVVLAGRYAVLYGLVENPAECVDLSHRLLELSQRQGLRLMSLSGAISVAQASMRFGEFRTADRYLDQARTLSKTLDHPPREWLVNGWVVMREAMRGRLDIAESAAFEVHRQGRSIGQQDADTWFYGQLFTIRMMQGQLPEFLEELHGHVGDVEDLIPAWKPALALALAEAGHEGAANEYLDDMCDEGAVSLPQDMLWLNGMGYLTMAAETLGRNDLAPGLYETLAPYSGMVAMNGTVDAGPVELHLGILAHLSGRAESADAHLNAALRQSRRMGAKVWKDAALRRLGN